MLGCIKGEFVIVSNILTSGVEGVEDSTVLNYKTKIKQNGMKLQFTVIASSTRVKIAPTFILPGKLWGKFGQEPSPPPDAFIIKKLETSFSNPVYRAHGNTNGFIVEKKIKPRATQMFGYLG